MATLVTGRMVQDQSITLNDLTQSSGALMFRNKIINGNFDIWQRGTSFDITTDNTYTADRWVTIYSGTGATRTISRQTFALGQTNVPNEPTYFLRWNQSIAGTSGIHNVLLQRIESVKTFANKNIIISFYAKAAANMNIGVYAGQIFGTGGSPSPAVYTSVTQVSLSNIWQRYSINLTIPSIADKALGSNNNDYLEISFALPLNTTFTFDIAQVQVEEGTVATPFEQRPIGMELLLCQRYYQYFPFQYINSVYHAITVFYKTSMRANPLITWGGTFSTGYPVGITTESFIGYSTSNSTNPLTLNAEL